MDALRQHNYQVYGGCTLSRALEMYRARFHREPSMIVAHPKQAATIGSAALGGEWCQCSATPGQGPWYLSPSRKELEG
jgi:hypothetical protein